MQKFTCSACGRCCSKISGLISDQEKEFIEEFGFGKMPLVQIIPVDEMSFPLWDFEAKLFKEYEKKYGIDARIRPSRGIMDLNSNRFIVVTYHMNSEACPFLFKDGKCAVYSEKRAFVCRLFPFNKSPFLDTGQQFSRDFFGSCPNTTDILNALDYADKEKLVKELYDSFGETFLAAVQHDLVTEWSNKLIIDLMKDKIIRPAFNYPYDFLLKRISNSQKIDLMDFLVECNYKTEEEVKELTERFYNLEDARSLTGKFSSAES